jgi:hypothetical protein
MTAVPFAVRFRRRIDAMVAQGQELLRTFRRLVESKISRRGTFRFIVAAMRHRIDALLPQGEVVVRTIHHLLGNLSPRKKVMAFVVAGVAGLALLLLLLLEISVRRELAAEARHVAIDTVSASSASAQEIQFEDRFAIQPAASTLLQPVDPLDALGTIPSSEYSQTFGQPIREPVPVPRRRKAR